MILAVWQKKRLLPVWQKATSKVFRKKKAVENVIPTASVEEPVTATDPSDNSSPDDDVTVLVDDAPAGQTVDDENKTVDLSHEDPEDN